MIRTKISAFAAAAVLIGVSAVPVLAANSYSQNYALIDEANLFDAAGSEQLCATLEKTGRETGWQVAVVTTTYNISAGEMDSYYNNYYDNHREWFTTDSAMLIIDTGSNNRYILTHGVAEAYFSLRLDLRTGRLGGRRYFCRRERGQIQVQRQGRHLQPQREQPHQSCRSAGRVPQQAHHLHDDQHQLQQQRRLLRRFVLARRFRRVLKLQLKFVT